MQDLLLLLVTLFFLCVGFIAPFILSLGYVWVDVFTPHLVSGSLLVDQPIAMFMAVSALGAYLLADRRDPPKFTLLTMVQVLLGIWITCTTQWAVSPEQAFVHWDLAVKVLGFATFLPWVIRSRVHIEALMMVYLFSLAGHIIPWGVKTVFTGGGYSLALGLLHVNSSILSESSSVSAIAVIMIPLLLAVKKHSILLPKTRATALLTYALVGICLVAAVGTFARTALVAFAVTGIAMFLRSKHKIYFILVAGVLGAVLIGFTSDRWTARISTVADYENENSAYVRVLVWQWGLEFLNSHPFGGGFFSFMVNRIEVPNPNGGAAIIQYGRAFHNVFVALLAEHGYIGFGLYVGMLVLILLGLQKAQKLTRDLPEHAWCAELSKALQVAILTIYACGNFVEIGWTPIVWYLLSASISLREYARRVASKAPITLAGSLGSRGAALDLPMPVGAPVFGRPRPSTAFRSVSQGVKGGW